MLKKEPAVWTRGAALRARRSSGRPRAPAAGKSARAASLEGVFALLWWKFTTFQAVAWNLDGVGCWWGKKRRKQVQEEVAVREVLQKNPERTELRNERLLLDAGLAPPGL